MTFGSCSFQSPHEDSFFSDAPSYASLNHWMIAFQSPHEDSFFSDSQQPRRTGTGLCRFNPLTRIRSSLTRKGDHVSLQTGCEFQSPHEDSFSSDALRQRPRVNSNQLVFQSPHEDSFSSDQDYSFVKSIGIYGAFQSPHEDSFSSDITVFFPPFEIGVAPFVSIPSRGFVLL